MSLNQRTNIAYGLTQALVSLYPDPIISARVPGTTDFAQLATVWIVPATNTVYMLSSVANNVATWTILSNGGGGGVFNNLTVTPGPTSITGATTINTAGGGLTTIGTGGTGAVRIGNATGNTSITGAVAVSGNYTSGAGDITLTAGAITLTNGDLTLTNGDANIGGNAILGGAGSVFQFVNGVFITSGAGAPAGMAPQGSLYLRTNGTGTGDRAYINTDGANTWTAITTAA